MEQVPNSERLWIFYPESSKEIRNARSGDPDSTTFMLNGNKMRTKEEMHEEFSSAMNFPSYYGNNWAALEECLSDLDWIDPAGDVELIFEHRSKILVDNPEAWGTLLSVLVDVARRWYMNQPSDSLVTFRSVFIEGAYA